MDTGGIPPSGIELVSRYHNLDGTGGFAILESFDAAALADYAIDWNGLINIEITAIMDDETIGDVLGKKIWLITELQNEFQDWKYYVWFHNARASNRSNKN